MMNVFVENVKRKIESKNPPKNESKKPKKNKKKAEVVEDDCVPGAVYVGHIPHGFYEVEMRKFFSQFGKVLRLRLVRSRKTGNSKGYAFVEFQSEEVAKVVAECMNNYLFFEKLLKCEFIPSDKLNPNVFDGWKRKLLSSDINRIKENRKKTDASLAKSKKRRVSRLKKLKASLKEKDIVLKIKPFMPKAK